METGICWGAPSRPGNGASNPTAAEPLKQPRKVFSTHPHPDTYRHTECPSRTDKPIHTDSSHTGLPDVANKKTGCQLNLHFR